MKAWLTAAFFALSFRATGQDVQVTAHWIEMPQENLTSLLSGETAGDKLFEAARKMVREQKAKAFDTSVQRLRTGEKALAESTVEIISPTEPEPPEGGPMPTKQTDVASKVNLPPPLRLPVAGPAFETRNVGLSSEIEAVADAEGWMRIRLRMEHSFYPRDLAMDDPWADRLGNRNAIKRPLFVSLKQESAHELVSGKWSFVGTQSAHDPDGTINPDRKILLFLRADVLEN